MQMAEHEPGYSQRATSRPSLEGLIVMLCKGDSMEKLIMNGSKIVVDTNENAIVSGSIYVLSVPWEGFILRECYAEADRLVLRAYNKNYPDITLSWDEYDPEMVVGKVYCSVINVFR